MDKITVIVPCYNEELSLPLFYAEINKITEQMKSEVQFRLLFVDDGSKDKTPQILEELSQTDDKVDYLSFSRNFGKEAAMYAGLEHADGDYVVIMDADLQHDPVHLIEMYRIIRAGEADCVATRRVDRKGEPAFRSFFARQFYKLTAKISPTEIVDGAQDYRMMTAQMAEAVLSLKEYNRFSKGIFSWVGFTTKWIECENIERKAGETKWSFWKLFLYSLDGITAFSTAPLLVASLIGVLFCLIALGLVIFIIIHTIIFGNPTAGFPTLICVIFMIGGIVLLCIGILGQYLAKTYLESKNRPIYILKKASRRREEK
ncbi:MAG: glycosyltransferase family 2 protein [Christensenellaceae bacterium]|jgi:glucosyltransferase